jgi:hypothetical protein
MEDKLKQIISKIVRPLMPDNSEEEIIQAEYNLKRYFDLVLRRQIDPKEPELSIDN